MSAWGQRGEEGGGKEPGRRDCRESKALEVDESALLTLKTVGEVM